jgi:death-on-curing family protein
LIEGGGGTIHLDVEVVLLVHAEIFRISLGAARDRVLKPEGLASAVSRPLTYEHYRDADLALQGAVLAHGIAEGQIFVDGNKRTGLEVMRLFLDINGVVLRAPQSELAEWMLDLASGTTPEELAEHIRRRIE